MNIKEFSACFSCSLQKSCTNYKGADHYALKTVDSYGIPFCYSSKILFRDKVVIVFTVLCLLGIITAGVMRGLGKL